MMSMAGLDLCEPNFIWISGIAEHTDVVVATNLWPLYAVLLIIFIIMICMLCVELATYRRFVSPNCPPSSS